MEYRYKRIVVGPNPEGRSAVLSTTASNVQEQPGFFYRATLWSTAETPVDNRIEGDRAEVVGVNREPPPHGSLVRILELHPEKDTKEQLTARFKEVNQQFGQKHMPSAEDTARHPLMHKTDTLDIIFVFRGEIVLITDVDEITCSEGDCILIRGTNHAWSNRSDQPCLMMGVMLNAEPM